MSAISIAVELKKVSVYYGQVCALRDVDLIVKPGDFLAVIGPNGSGKSTLLKVILGLIKPSSGQVLVDSQPVFKARGAIGYVPQFTQIDRNFPISVNEIVLMGRLGNKRRIFSKYTGQDQAFARNIMKLLDIYDLRDRTIGQLSGGQLKRALIARALAAEPVLLLLDEPTSDLDAASKSQTYSLLHELNKSMTIIMVTHDMHVVSSYVKSLACLNTSLYYHGEPELNSGIVGSVYGCPVDLIAHGVPHRVLQRHEEGPDDQRSAAL